MSQAFLVTKISSCLQPLPQLILTLRQSLPYYLALFINLFCEMVMKTMYLHRQMDFFTFLMLFNLCIQITHLLHNLDFSPVRIPCLLVRLNYDKVKVKMKSLSHVQLFVTPRTVAYQAPPSMVFSRQEYWSRLPFPSPSVPPIYL